MAVVRLRVALLLVGLLVACGVIAAFPAVAADTGNAAPQAGRIVSDDPASFTPHVMNGEVFTMAQVGNLIVVGGRFSTVRNAGSATDIPRRNLFAFNATTGQVSTTFAPNPNSSVYKLLDAGDGQSVFIGGQFTSVTSAGSSVSVSRLYKADTTTGNRIATFQPGSFSYQVRDLSLIGNRLWVAGKFTSIQGAPQTALGTLNATTGARDNYFRMTMAGTLLDGTSTNVLQIATNPQNTQLVAVGNFGSVNGVTRSQFAVFDISGASPTLADYYTRNFESPCNGNFETYMTDVDYSPDGSFFVVSTAGGYGGFTASNNGTSGCDVVARFESNASGSNVQPTWTAYTGGDTTWSIEVTQDVVYTGGHFRWQNNPDRGNAADEGAVSRPGIAALNTVNGVPYSWNPTRTLGEGVKDMIATPQGLWVGSDTDTFAGETRRKIAFLPLATGDALEQRLPLTLPGDIFRVASGQSQLLRRGFDGSQVTSSSDAPNGTGWGTAVGAFMTNGRLYTAYSNGTFTRRTFNGQTYGPSITVSTADQLEYQDDWHVNDVPAITSLFYHHGRIYFTKTGSSQLFNRKFEPESDIVGEQLFSVGSVSGVSYSGMRGAFVADSKLYFASSNGTLNVATWSGDGAVSGTASVVAGAGTGWSSRVMFLYQGTPIAPPPEDQPPTASFTVSCTQLVCDVDGSASDDPDGDVVDYAWDFGDGATSAGPSPTASHEYAGAGARTVTLTVTDNDNLTNSTTRTANPSITQTDIQFVAAASTAGNRQNHTVTVPGSTQPGDLLLLFFVANSQTPTYSGPSGWTEVEAQAGDGTVGRAFVRTATAADAGRPVTVVSSGYAKSVISVAAYRGVNATTPVTAAASALQTSSTTTHVTPTVVAPDGNQWLVSYWADKSNATSAWTLPASVTQRTTASGSPSGHISAILGDSNGPVPAGPAGGLTATANSTGGSAITFSVLVNPG